ncbi:unnamed protein product [Caretta caretta]
MLVLVQLALDRVTPKNSMWITKGQTLQDPLQSLYLWMNTIQVQKKIEFKERDTLEKEPSMGSDWSDVDEVEPLARLSQEDSVPHHNRPVILETSPVITDYVTYPAHLYSHPWGDFVKCWTSSPKPPNHSFSNPSEDTSYLGGSSSSHLCDISVEFAASTPSNI